MSVGLGSKSLPKPVCHPCCPTIVPEKFGGRNSINGEDNLADRERISKLKGEQRPCSRTEGKQSLLGVSGWGPEWDPKVRDRVPAQPSGNRSRCTHRLGSPCRLPGGCR